MPLNSSSEQNINTAVSNLQPLPIQAGNNYYNEHLAYGMLYIATALRDFMKQVTNELDAIKQQAGVGIVRR